MKKSEIHEWNAPNGFWYTEAEEVDIRTFVQHLRSQDPHFVDNYQLWTDAQKEEWEKDHSKPINDIEND